MDNRAIDFEFGERPELTDEQRVRMRAIQQGTLSLARTLLDHVPFTPDRERALDALKQVRLQAEAGIRVGRSILTLDVLATLLSPIEAQDKRVARIWFNVYDYADIRKFGRDILDTVTDITEMRRGKMAVIWNAEIWCSRRIPKGWARVLADGDNLDLPERDLTEADLIRIH